MIKLAKLKWVPLKWAMEGYADLGKLVRRQEKRKEKNRNKNRTSISNKSPRNHIHTQIKTRTTQKAK